MHFSTKGSGQDQTPRRTPSTTNNKSSVGKHRSTRRAFLMRSAAVVGGAAVGANYVTPKMTTVSIPSAFASNSPLPATNPSDSGSSHSHSG